MSMLLSLQAGVQSVGGAAENMPEFTNVAAPTEAQLNILELAMKGGWVMVVLLVLSVLAAYIFIQRVLIIKRAGKQDRKSVV